MRFRKGSKVEVLSNREVPWGEWRCAHVISSNGHTYSVQYDFSSMTSEVIVERVPRKAIRPCPPLVKGVESCTVKDVVEIYDVGCWKGAIILKFLGGDFYLVRLLGSCKELKVHKVNTRVRQSWQDDQWVVMQKGSGNSGVGKSSKYLISNNYNMTHEVQPAINECLPGIDGSGLRESHLASSTTLKRVSPYCSSPIEAYPRKMRAVMDKRESKRFIPVSTTPFMGNVDVVAYPQKNMGEKCIDASFNNGSSQYYEMERWKPINVTTHFLKRIEEPDDSCSDVSSVGSCSVISSKPNKSFGDILVGPCQDVDTLCSNAKSLDVGDVDKRCSLAPKEDAASKIHRLELDAYRSTLDTMYASGPLSWEQEALLTNLRISLHISNDEYLTEIRNLIYDGHHF